MAHSHSPSTNHGYVQEVRDLVVALSEVPERESVGSEIEVLQSIYGDTAVRLYHPSSENHSGTSKQPEVIRYEVTLNLPSPHDHVSIKILVSLPPTYPTSSSPQLQLLSRYIGDFGADSNLFGSILRTYISVSGVEWSEDSLCVFDGLQNVLERCVGWYEEHLNLEKIGQLVRDETRDTRVESPHPTTRRPEETQNVEATNELSGHNLLPTEIPPGINIHVAEPIQDRKSTFVGRACRIYHPSEVPLIITHLQSDRRISRAAHPVIHAWRCRVGNVLHQDNDDDGETAAGGRLAHLLQILEVDNVLVIVTRYFGGIHLGPDRFKHINQAARNALDVGGYLDTHDNKNHIGRGRKH